MKNTRMQVGLALAFLLVLADTAVAGPAFDVPDGGSSALLLVLALAGVGAVRRLLR